MSASIYGCNIKGLELTNTLQGRSIIDSVFEKLERNVESVFSFHVVSVKRYYFFKLLFCSSSKIELLHCQLLHKNI